MGIRRHGFDVQDASDDEWTLDRTQLESEEDEEESETQEDSEEDEEEIQASSGVEVSNFPVVAITP